MEYKYTRCVNYQQNLHLDEAETMVTEDGRVFHSYNFLSVLRAVGAPRSVKILTVTKEGKFQIESVVIEVNEWLILGPGVWHAGDNPYEDVKSKLLFFYYEHASRDPVTVLQAVESPFAAEMGEEWSDIVERNVFPWYLERRQANGETQRYHYKGNVTKYQVAVTDTLVEADQIAATITRFENLGTFGGYLQEYGLPRFNNVNESWRWIKCEVTNAAMETDPAITVDDGITLDMGHEDEGTTEMIPEIIESETIEETMEGQVILTLDQAYHARRKQIVVKVGSEVEVDKGGSVKEVKEVSARIKEVDAQSERWINFFKDTLNAIQRFRQEWVSTKTKAISANRGVKK